MPPYFFTVGPSQIHPAYTNFFSEAMQASVGSVYHRSEAFHSIYRYTDEQLRELMQLTADHRIYFTGGASEIWERILLNLSGHSTHHLINGAFSRRFYEYSLALGRKASASQIERGQGFPADISLPTMDTELTCVVQNETSTGVFIPDSHLTAYKNQYPSSLLCADLVSVAPVSMPDFSRVDTAFFSVQKAFGMPPGLGVWLANEACLEKASRLHQQGMPMGAHHTLLSFEKNYRLWETPSTPNTMAIFILGKIAAWMNRTGPTTLRSQIQQKADALYTFADASDLFPPLVKEPAHRSPTVIVLQCGPYGQLVKDFLQKRGFMISAGYGADNEIRIGNFPATTLEQTEELIAYLRQFESGL